MKLRSVGIFKKIFGKKEQKDTPAESNLKEEPNTQNQTFEAKNITLDELTGINVKEIISVIKKKRENNIKKFEEIYAKAEKLISQGKVQKAQDLTSQDVLSYFPVYKKAEKLEKEGNLEEAAEIYWSNIYKNGTDAPANFKRLLIVLSRLDRKKEELSVAKIYSAFVKGKDREKLERRIENIRNKIDSDN
jgi:hypothetical protein